MFKCKIVTVASWLQVIISSAIVGVLTNNQLILFAGGEDTRPAASVPILAPAIDGALCPMLYALCSSP
ncbi:MAG TPA: hypothetical protein PLV75_07660 [Saprospiraceae bacterium]|nr:hypothetical protein [Saprospiraceae bacterium]